MTRYLETFYRHRLLILTPVLLAVLFGVAIVLVKPPMYESSARIWFDASPLDATASAGQGSLTPADQAAAMVKELLTTSSFCVKVGQGSGLADYLAQASAGGGLRSLARRLLGQGGWPVPAGGPNGVDDATYQVLNQNTRVSSQGAQIVAISFDAPNAALAQRILQSLVDQFTGEIVSVRRTQSEAVTAFFQQQVTDQTTTLSTAQARLVDYETKHPKAGASDATLVALQNTADLARQRYEALLQELDQAKLDSAAQSQPGGSGFRVVDPASLPAGRLGVVATVLHTALAALAAGLLIALFCLVALTAADRSLRRPDEVKDVLGLRLVGAIPRIP